MSDDDQLEVLLLPPSHHDVAQSLCQARTVLSVQVGGWLVQGQDPTVQTEGFSQSQPNDQTCQHLQSKPGQFLCCQSISSLFSHTQSGTGLILTRHSYIVHTDAHT